jgi:RNA 2',3'-cyclic 3'-phosphodiesterase
VPSTLRLFLAINLPEETKREIAAATTALRESAPELTWVRDSQLHLTIKFLGDQPAERLNEIQAAIAQVAERHRELTMELAGFGAFPNFRRARVVWMGVAQEPRLELLHHDVEVACDQLGVEMEGRPFRPHLTLARVKGNQPEERMRMLARAAKGTEYSTDVVVRSIDLMQSDLTANGAQHTMLASASLRSE